MLQTTLHFSIQSLLSSMHLRHFFWQTANSTKIEIFCLPPPDSFLEHFIVTIVERRSKSSETWHDNVKMSTHGNYL